MGKLIQLNALKVALNVYDMQTNEERRPVTGECEQTVHYSIHTYVDEMDYAVNKAHATAPTSLYLIGRNCGLCGWVRALRI